MTRRVTRQAGSIRGPPREPPEASRHPSSPPRTRVRGLKERAVFNLNLQEVNV